MILPARALAAVFGERVEGSLSPRIHRAAGDATGFALDYVALSADDAATFARGLEALRSLGAVGANVTHPYKFSAVAACDVLDAPARATEAVNTITWRAGRAEGANTDAPGFLRWLDDLQPEGLVHVLGTGGSARAVAWALERWGARFVVSGRREGAFDDVAPLAPRDDAVLVVSTLPPSASDVAAACLNPKKGARVVDLTYGGSALVARAQSMGLRAEDGRRLLVEQGALAFSGWTGAPLDRVRSAMAKAAGFDSIPGPD